MSPAAADIKGTLETIELLQYRLQRIEFLLTGSDDGQAQLHEVAARGRDHGVLALLAKAESDLARIASKSPLVNDLLALRKVLRCVLANCLLISS